MKRWIKFLTFILVCSFIYSFFLFLTDRQSSTGSYPVINHDQSVITASVNDDDSRLLEGVSATDNEDGDLTSRVFVESISEFNESNQRTITYAVIDDDDNISRSQRLLQYSDYQPPEITISKPLCYLWVESTEEFLDYVEASSQVDGDLSSKIQITTATETQEGYSLVFSVTDSCGMSSSLKLDALRMDYTPNVEITLSDYLIKVPVGTVIDPDDYIESVKVAGMNSSSLEDQIEVINDYDRRTPGTYEFIYRISTGSSDYGTTKLVVIVEEG